MNASSNSEVCNACADPELVRASAIAAAFFSYYSLTDAMNKSDCVQAPIHQVYHPEIRRSKIYSSGHFQLRCFPGPRSRKERRSILLFTIFLLFFFVWGMFLESVEILKTSDGLVPTVIVFSAVICTVAFLVNWGLNLVFLLSRKAIRKVGTSERLASLVVPRRVFETACLPSLWEVNNEKVRRLSSSNKCIFIVKVYFGLRVAVVIADCLRIAAVDFVLFKYKCKLPDESNSVTYCNQDTAFDLEGVKFLTDLSHKARDVDIEFLE